MISLLMSILPLALLDAVSVGALAMPVWFLISDRVRHGYLCLYLAVLALAYAALGLALVNGPAGLREGGENLLNSTAGDWIRGLVGVALMAFAAWYGLVHKVSVRAPGGGSEAGWLEEGRSKIGRFGAWRDGAVGENASVCAVVGLALVATLVEIPTAVPYAIALGRVDETNPGLFVQVGAVGVYAAVMVLPAFALTVGSRLARAHVAGLLHRVDRWFRVNAQENTAWLIAIVGLAVFFETQLYDSVMNLVSDPNSAQGRPLQ